MKIKANKIATASMALVTALSPIMYSLPVNAATPALSNTSVSVNVGKTVTLSMKNVKSGTKVAWKSSNTKIATVSSKGVVKGIKTGSAYVYATVSKKQYRCKVTVKSASSNVKVQSIGLSIRGNKLPTFDVGVTGYIDYTVSPSNAKNRTVNFKSSNSSVVSISSTTGRFTTKKAGTAVITATAADGSKTQSTITLTVKKLPTLISSIKVQLKSGCKSTLYGKNQTTEVKAYVSPSKATNKKIRWSSSNTNVATVNSDGLVTSVNPGTARITATALDGSGVSSYIEIKVIKTGSIDLANIKGSAAYNLLNRCGFILDLDTTSTNQCVGKFMSIKVNELRKSKIYHEVGHVISYALRNSSGKTASQTNTFQAIYQKEKDKLNGYKKTIDSPEEYFAEAYTLYEINKAQLSRSCPETYRYMVTYMNALRQRYGGSFDTSKLDFSSLHLDCGTW